MGTPLFAGEGDAVGAAGVFGAGDDGGCGPRVFGVFGACGVAAAATPGFAAVLLACGFTGVGAGAGPGVGLGVGLTPVGDPLCGLALLDAIDPRGLL